MENSTLVEIIIATVKKDENESQNSMSDGEIVDDDDDEVEDIKSSLINFPLKKLQKNFRARNSAEETDEEEKVKVSEKILGIYILNYDKFNLSTAYNFMQTFQNLT